MMTKTDQIAETSDDSRLVSESLRGDREAFGEIVARYQTLVCSLAYSATGSLTKSEDLAQETFLTAWKQLGTLRDPGKLRPWLCRIARNLICDGLRKQRRDPSHEAEPLEAGFHTVAIDSQPVDEVIGREEQAILWRSVERIPEIYREPLILFYREHHSVASVAAALELSEDAVKQRLSRGRKLLHEQVLSFVEGALERTAPGRGFTLGVIAALPVFATSAAAATVGSAAAHGSATAKGATLVGLFNALIGPAIGLLGAYIGVKASLNSTRTPRERQFVIQQAKGMGIASVGFNILVAGYILAALNYWESYPLLFTILGILIPATFTGFIVSRARQYNRDFQRLRAEEQLNFPHLFKPEASTIPLHTEYRSRWTFLGLPLVHVRNGTPIGEKSRPAVGWIAIGDRAYGILLAIGGVAVGGISMGGVAIGLVSLGGLSAGVIALGGVALGGIAMGGAAVGLLASGGFATGYFGAIGGLAVANEFALGGKALAEHANDAQAREFFAQYPWLNIQRPSVRTFTALFCWLPLLLFGLFFWRKQKARKNDHSN